MRVVPAGVAAAVALLTLAACTEEPPAPLPTVSVTGEPGSVPDLEYPVPLSVPEPVVEVVWEGDGPEVVDGQAILVDYYAETGGDGTVLGETFTGEPKAFLLTAEALGVDIYEALRGQRVGTRVLHLVPPAEGQQAPTVAVFDLLPTRAQGEAVAPREGLPTVELDDHGAPTITVPAETPAPVELVVQPLIRGAGPQVEPGQVITVQYTGVRWSDGTEFDSTWAAGELPAPFPIGVGSVIAGWDTGLVEQTVGSQVLLVVPPTDGYGGTDDELAEETLVFVVDILAASGGPAAG